MDLCSTHLGFLFFICNTWIYAGMMQGECNQSSPEYEYVYSVPGEVAMLDSKLLFSNKLDSTNESYDITWYNSKTGEALRNQTHKIFIVRETLWIFNTTLKDAGRYETEMRSSSQRIRKSFILVMNQSNSEQCVRPWQVPQGLTYGTSDWLNCPLQNYITKLKNYKISFKLKWKRDCEPIAAKTWDKTKLVIQKVENDSGFYTCTLEFTLDGVPGFVSETIQANVNDKYSWVPRILQPLNETIKAKGGSNFSKRCEVFVQGNEKPSLEPLWYIDGHRVSTNLSLRISETKKEFKVTNGSFLFRKWLIISEVREEDFHINYTCKVQSARLQPEGYFTLIPAESDFLPLIACVLGGMGFMFMIVVATYNFFRIEIILWFRATFGIFYANKDLDGKLYDAYVAYPPASSTSFTDEIETFVFQTLPQVLEESCGFKLFIEGRDLLPGQAMVDSVEENIQASRRLLLLYTASTFTRRTNSFTSTKSDGKLPNQSAICDISVAFKDMRHQFECVAAMGRALLEESLQVILVELEEIGPDQMVHLPESVRHLRKKQGAVCLWKNLKKRKRWEDEQKMGKLENQTGTESTMSVFLCPSSRFWKEIRYHMPVRGKRSVNV